MTTERCCTATTGLKKASAAQNQQDENLEAQNNFSAALRVDPNFVMANLYGGTNDPLQNRKYRNTAVVTAMHQKSKKVVVCSKSRFRVKM